VTTHNALVKYRFVNAFIGPASRLGFKRIQSSIDSLIPLGTTPVIRATSL
jgi:hypothetical protein